MKRIIIHWTGGGNTFNDSDAKHYHFGIDGTGKVHEGNLKPEANLDCTDGNYAAHTRRCNTGAIGVALCGMHGAVERPLSVGDHPITKAQIRSLIELCADLCEIYDIPVTRRTVLTHAEVQPTLGIKQRGKWDITWLPGWESTGHAVTIGDGLRKQISAAMTKPVKPPRKSAAQSTTVQASVTQIAAGAGTAVTAVSALSGTAQIVALALAGVIVLAGLWVMRERLKHWAQGVR